jgi:hypothetical protein
MAKPYTSLLFAPFACFVVQKSFVLRVFQAFLGEAGCFGFPSIGVPLWENLRQSADHIFIWPFPPPNFVCSLLSRPFRVFRG